MEREESNVPPFLLQARRYVRAAKWGFENMLRTEPVGAAFHFHIIGIFAILRAVQSVTKEHDRWLSPKHAAAVTLWEKRTANWRDIPEVSFLKEARDRALKDGTLSAWATTTEGETGYDLAYYDACGDRHDLEEKLSSAIEWCEKQIAEIEKSL